MYAVSRGAMTRWADVSIVNASADERRQRDRAAQAAPDLEAQNRNDAAGSRRSRFLRRQQQQSSASEAAETPPGHGREASGRSLISNLSDRMASLRQRDRDRTLEQISARIERAQADDEARARLRQELSNQGPTPASAYILGAMNSSSVTRTKGKSRREKEEAVTLFGPNLANYFGSGSSSSGAVAGGSMAIGGVAGGTSANAPAPDADEAPIRPGLDRTGSEQYIQGPGGATYGNSLLAGRARLGSRGRARGASLSGLTALSIGMEGAADSAADLSNGAGANGGSVDAEAVAMAEGIELETLKRWIDRSIGGGAVEVEGSAASSQAKSQGPAPAVCSTLQSYVNLKRNTVKLRVVPTEADADEPQTPVPISPAMASPDSPAFAHEDRHHLRSVTSLGAMSQTMGLIGHPLSAAWSGNGTGAAAAPSATVFQSPPPTHTLEFEYDCAAPHASVQVFLRASRKHGSWLTWSTNQAQREAEGETMQDTPTGYYAERNAPPPHILGWPVFSAKLKRGFGEPLSTKLALKLQYYAPPGAEEARAAAKAQKEAAAVTGGEGAGPAKTEAQATEAVPDADPLVTTGTAATQVEAVTETLPPQPELATSPEVETKEARLAREKAQRETLKLAIVVEALDEDGKPLRDPNLQTTYLRLISLPAKSDNTITLPIPEHDNEAETVLALPARDQRPSRIWSVQVEGQEAEIGPHRFQLQELYALSTRPPPVKPAPVEPAEGEDGAGATETAAPAVLDMEGSNGSECLICLTSPPTTLLLPCTHGLCVECAVQLRESVRKQREIERRRGKQPKRKFNCPVCRRAYTSMLHLTRANEKETAQSTAQATIRA